MNKAMTFLMFVLAFAYSAKAGGIIAEDGFTTGTGFEYQEPGEFHPEYDDNGEETGVTYWNNEAATNSASVALHSASDPAYDYAANGTRRSPFLVDDEPTTAQFLAINLDAPLERQIMPRETGGAVSNTLTKTAAYDGIYADTLVKLSPSTSGPTVDGTDRIIVWMQEVETEERLETNLVITAGRYVGGYGSVTAANYRVASPAVSADTWCRMTIRAIPDVTEYQGGKGIAKRAPGFTVYFDGRPAVIHASDFDQAGFETIEGRILSAEARVLISERRLLPGLTAAASSGSVALSRLSFGGRGAVDDTVFTTECPEYAVRSEYTLAENVFTLNWDAGITGHMKGIVSNADEIVPFDIDTAELPRYRDFSLGTNNYALVTITDVAYDYAHDYSNGVWGAANDCAVTNGNSAFAYDGKSRNPIGYVLSSRRVVGIGENAENGCSSSFAEAKALAKRSGIKKIVLETDMVITNMTKSQAQVAGLPYYDSGSLEIAKGDDFILDLNGHTLRGSGANPTVMQSGGKLRITDSSKTNATGMTGRILPSTRAAKNSVKVAVRSSASPTETPELTIDAGWFDGLVAVTGSVVTARFGTPTNYMAVCVVEGGGYTNSLADARHFYLEQYVTNPVTYFGLTGDYWTTATNGFIWCGKGADDRWTNKDNWKCKAVPGAGDLAIFPTRETDPNEWDVDFGSGVATKALWLDADIRMAGTNEFSDVKVPSGAGRFNGAGLATFTGALPGKLTGETGTGEMRIGAGWTGTVKISNVMKSAKSLANVEGWGNVHSTVEFNGVRGYLSDRANHPAAYRLVLTDLVTDGGAKTNSAWQNETGYTGSVVSFPVLTGSGTFDSPKNLREILQVFQFKDVKDFTGTFKLGGKRILLGTGSVAAKAKAGHFTFSNKVSVRSGLGWEGVNAHFGTNLVVLGEIKQTLMSYDKKESPAVDAVVVTLINPATGATNETCRLFAADGKITVESAESVNYAGRPVAAEDVGASVKAGSTFEVPPGSAVTIDGNRVIVNGVIVSSFAEYYKVMSAGGLTYSVEFDEEEATPTLAEVTLVPGEDGSTANVRVDNAKDGLWYGLQAISSLAMSWDGAPTEWKQAVGDTVTFESDAAASSAYFRVIMTDRDPTGGAK